MIKDILNNKFNARLFEKMNADDKRVVSNFVRRCNLDVEIPEDTFNHDFQLLKGEFLAGNDSIQIKNELKKYTLHGMNEGRLPRSTALLLLYQLSL